MRVIGTAGHVDHGKSALVKALTGIDPDRLKEEKEREMTIDLGFAWLTLPSGEQVGIVDVPGHKDFIKNMLAGVGGIDAALFVVAADEGVMPQTREHLAILDLLNVRGGVVALTKVDLAEDEEWLELVTADLEDTLRGSCLEDAPIVRVSARTGEGLDTLVQELDRFLSTIEPRRDLGRPRLPVDRVFTIAGFGTVVTGTLMDGSLHLGQEVEILPQGLKARIRGLQTHKRKIETAVPGSRVAINLSGVSKDQLKRGDVVASPGWLKPTTLVDVQVRYLADAPRPLRHNQEVDFFCGAAEVPARVRLLGRDTLPPGETGWAQLRLQEPVALVRGDRYIIRLLSPSITIGGGIVVDPHPRRRHRRFRPEVIARLETLAHGTPEDILLQSLETQQPCSVQDLLRRCGLPGEEATAALDTLLRERRVIALGIPDHETPPTVQSLSPGQLVISRTGWQELLQRLTDELSAYHRRYPLRQGMPREELKSRARSFAPFVLQGRAFNEMVAQAAKEGIVVEEGAIVRLAGHQVRFSAEQEQQVQALLQRFQQRPYVTPSVSECIAQVGEDVFNALLEQGRLVRLSDDVVYLRETYQEMVEQVIKRIKEQGGITVAQVRDMFQASRKYALALMEHLDEIKVTKRVGDERVLR